MKIIIENEITIVDPTKDFINYCKKELVMPNPDYAKKLRMHLWTGNVSKNLYLYRVDGDTIKVPYGLQDKVLEFTDDVEYAYSKHPQLNYLSFVPLRHYQFEAVDKMYEKGFGILEAPCSSGKTQIGLALIMKYNTRALWLTHTKDLLNQSMERAKEFCDESLFGTITEGKVNLGKAITFATVQTMCRLNLPLYRDLFDIVIVDEVHRVATSSTSVTQFQKVLENLNARHKFGLSATIHRADGLIKTTFALIGNVTHTIPKESISEFLQEVKIKPIVTPTKFTFDFADGYIKTDGTIVFSKLTTFVADNVERNNFILKDLIENKDNFNLVLSSRVSQLCYFNEHLSDSILIDGKTKKGREDLLNEIREGKKHYLLATYKLAKEGLDIPRLDRLYLATPEKDSAIIKQSIGRIARTFSGKCESIVYDYVDNCKIYVKYYKERMRTYKKERCEILE